MMESRRGWLGQLAATGGTAAFGLVASRPAGAQTGAPPSAGTSVTVVTAPTVDAAPFYYAVNTGLFEKAGLSLVLQTIASGNLGIQAIVAGAAQVGLANSLSLAQAHTHGIPVEVISGGGLYNSSIPVARIFVANDSPVRRAKDLEGRLFAISGLHDLLALSVKAWLASQGADGSKVRFIELPQGQMLAALQQRRVDAIGQFEPFATAAAESGDARSIATPYDAIAKQFNVTLWFAYGPWIAAHRDTTERFVRVMHAATEYANAHIPDMVPIVASATGMTVEVAGHALRNKTAPSALPSQLQPLIDSAAKFGELAAAFPARELLADLPL